MPTATAEAGNPFRRDVPSAEPAPAVPEFRAQPGWTANLGFALMNRGLGTREQIETELDGIAESIRAFHLKLADEVLRECSAYSARLSELKVLLHRVEGLSREYVRVRTMQVDVYLEEVDRQWKTASRLIEVERQNIALAGGGI